VSGDRIIRETDENSVQAFSFCLAIIVCILLCAFFGLAGNTENRIEAAKLESRINPNDAAIGSLVRFPGIVLSKATAISAYRRESRIEEPNKVAFENISDLQNVRGIGPKTAEKISQWMKFE
jgi:competence ComEA-like helix-hairpin-helix protein